MYKRQVKITTKENQQDEDVVVLTVDKDGLQLHSSLTTEWINWFDQGTTGQEPINKFEGGSFSLNSGVAIKAIKRESNINDAVDNYEDIVNWDLDEDDVLLTQSAIKGKINTIAHRIVRNNTSVSILNDDPSTEINEEKISVSLFGNEIAKFDSQGFSLLEIDSLPLTLSVPKLSPVSYTHLTLPTKA